MIVEMKEMNEHHHHHRATMDRLGYHVKIIYA
jgi:hypothetical protein